MTVGYGFNALLTAKPGMADRLVDVLLTGMDDGNPASSEHCLVYLVCRSASRPDLIHVTEGWTSEADHHRLFADEAAQAIVARIQDLVTGENPRTDYTPIGGKADL
ncbi:putative quinol monooxygenase [Rhodococcus sp. NPDC060084]|jgi:quinol monooxygenase YgiN